jgi:hypothetical protein
MGLNGWLDLLLNTWERLRSDRIARVVDRLVEEAKG